MSGLLGPAARLDKKSSAVSDTEVGQGGTTQWRLCSVDFDTAVSVYFDITASAK